MIPKYYSEQRQPEQILQQHNQVKKCTSDNMQRFQLQIPYNNNNKSNQEKIFYQIQKKIFDNGLYCYYTDNKNDVTNFQSNIVIFAVPGLPGSLKEFRQLHQQIGYNFCRWVNFIPPGADKEDDRRSKNYLGTKIDITSLFLRLIDSLQISKIILLTHSFGTFSINYFALTYPERLSGIINLGSPGISALFHQQMQPFLKQLKGDSRQDITIQDLNKDQIREKLYEQYLNSSYEENAFKAMPKSTIDEYIYVLKIYLNNDYETTNYFQRLRDSNNPILRFIACGEKDQIIDLWNSEEMLYYYAFGEKSWSNLSKNIFYDKSKINSIGREMGIQLNLDDIQQNFIFLMENEPHNIHQTCAHTLARPIQCYLRIIECLEEGKRKLNPKL